MKRIAYWCLAATTILLIGVQGSWAQDQGDDLAQYARQQKKQKETATAPAKVYDNDNMPKTENISVVGNESPASSAASPTDAKSPESQSSSDKESSVASDDKPPALEPGQSPEDRQQALNEWQGRIKQQKETLELAQRELDVRKREYALRAATVATDVGYRLRNSAEWDKEDKQYKEQIAAKQKEVDAAKQKLDELQSDARKAGVPTKLRE
jgi:hypothetical protein